MFTICILKAVIFVLENPLIDALNRMSHVFLCKYITYSSSGLYKHRMLRTKFCQLQHLDSKCSTFSMIVMYYYFSCIFFWKFACRLVLK